MDKKNIDIETNADILSRNGVVIIDDYYSKEVCEKIYEEATSIVDNIDYDESDIGDEIDSEGMELSKNGMNINIRGGRDKGMFDISGIDNSIEELSEFKQDKLIQEIIAKSSGKNPKTKSTNLYYKDSNTSTRGPHHDTFTEKYKSFIYLTNVESVSHGPYCYVEGSHNPSFITRRATRLINKIRGHPKTDSVFYGKDTANQITAKKGALIISNQTGVHFGHPQKEGYERMLVTNHHSI